MEFTIGHWLAVYYALAGVGWLGWLVSLWRARREWWKRRGAKAPDKGIDTSPCPLPGRGGEGEATLRQPKGGATHECAGNR